MLKDVKLLLEAKQDRLINIAKRKRRHKTEEEKKKYEERYLKARVYLGELSVIWPILEEVGFKAKTINESTLELLRKHLWIEKIFEGEFVKLYQNGDTQEYLLILSSCTIIEHFK